MMEFLLALGAHIRAELHAYRHRGLARNVHGVSPGGDAQFDVDAIAEDAALAFIREHAPRPLAVYTEDGSLVEIGGAPRDVLIIDPIDGTRPTSAGLEMGMISIAQAPLGSGDPRIEDVEAALLLGIKDGCALWGDRTKGLSSSGFDHPVPNLSRTTEIDRMFWSIEFNGHPMRLMASAYAEIVDRSANTGGVFVFNSATFSISRIVTGQLDAYVDIGNRIWRDHPATRAAFLAAGRGSILHLFPYDIAAAAFLADLAGVTISDAYGAPLGSTRLLDIAPENQRSCIAAATPELHAALLDAVAWDDPAFEARETMEVAR
ncbi:inositol monophosphatase family protein [Salinarimonas chemoclinalis]|uniref:inositol monophosphatase family protein n=1 Tax=Salinarimonas chemoclinalis TaxID=3241599 RepID=UPI003558F31B